MENVCFTWRGVTLSLHLNATAGENENENYFPLISNQNIHLPLRGIRSAVKF